MADSPLDSTSLHTSESDFSILSGPSTLDGTSGGSPSPSTPHDAADHRLPDLPAPDASILTDSAIPFRARPSYTHHTWAKTFYSRPEFLISPETIEEVQRIVLLARRCRRRVVVVGSGHSPNDLTCTSSWMVSLDNLSSVLSVDKYPTDRGPSTPEPKQYGGRVLAHAGISLENLNLALKDHGLTIPSLGSIHIQSVAGAIATGTHGSSLQHGLLSQNVRGLRIVLADGRATWCSATENGDLFRAALVSLGGLGIITEVAMEVSPAADIEWEQRLERLDDVLARWDTDLWTAAEFVRCWWNPYTSRVIVWKASKTTHPRRPPRASWYGGAFGFHSYHMMLWAAHYVPRLLPAIEWFVMGMQYGFRVGGTNSGVEEQRTGLLMDCLYSQFVNEWAIPLHRGPEALTRLSAWLNGDAATARIPFDAAGLWVHAPVEVRVADSSAAARGTRGFLDPTPEDGPALYLNATLYRPYGLDPPCRRRWYEAFEWLMREMGGRPHWAKNFATVTGEELEGMYGEGLRSWRGVRGNVDPEGMFVGAWQRRLLLGGGGGGGGGAGGVASAVAPGQGGREKPSLGLGGAALRLEERVRGTRERRWRGGVDWEGEQAAGQEDGSRQGPRKEARGSTIELIDDERTDGYDDEDDDAEDVALLGRLKRGVAATGQA